MRIVITTIIVAALLGGGAVFLWLYYGGFQEERSTAIAFIDEYGAYAEVSEEVEFLVHLPGTENNTDRAELLTLLNSILTETMEPERRDTLARLAFANLDAIKKEIDAAQVSQEKLYKTLQNLDNSARLFESIELRNKAGAIVALARKRTETTSRITSILSKINEQTYSIITRVLEENGELSSAHITELNAATDEAEERFDTLTSLYGELGQQKLELESGFTQFIRVAI